MMQIVMLQRYREKFALNDESVIRFKLLMSETHRRVSLSTQVLFARRAVHTPRQASHEK